MSVGTLAPQTREDPASAVGPCAQALIRNPTAITLAVLTALAAVLRFTRLGHQGFWFDEGNTALLVHFSPGKMIGLIPQTESTPPLYYCLAWIWARIFGYGETALRSLSALAGVAIVPVIYLAAAKLVSRPVGLISAALTACNPYLIWYSQEARSYELLVLFSAAMLLAFAYVRATPTPRLLAAWVLASALALTTHYYALLTIVPQALWLLAIHRRQRPVQVAIAAIGACGLALIPLALDQSGTGHASWIAPIPLLPRLGQIFPQFLIGYGAPAQAVLYAIAALTVLLALVLLVARSDASSQRAALGAGALAISGLTLNLVLVAGGVDDLITRNVIALWPAAAVLVAGGLGARRAGILGAAGAAVLCATGVVAAVGVAVDRQLERPDWRAVADVLGPRPATGTDGRAILVQHYRDLLPLSLYLPGLKFWPRQVNATSVSELDVVSISAPRVHLCWWGAACNLSGTQMQASYPIPGFRVLWRRRALQFTVLRLVSATPVRLTAKDVAAALSATTLPRDELLIQRSTS